jgi:hypothetical protein
LAAGVLVATAIGLSAASDAVAADKVSVVAVPALDLRDYATRGAVGLYVPGWGGTVTRRSARAALVSGRVEHASRAGSAGKPVIRLSRGPGLEATIYVALPPAGRSANDRRYPVAIVGAGYRGMLTSSSTRIDGLVSLADIAPTALALRDGDAARIRWRAAEDASGKLDNLDHRLDAGRDARRGVMVAVLSWVPLLCALTWLLRSPALGRAALLVPLVALLVSLSLAAAELADAAVLTGLHVALMGPVAIAVARTRLSLAALVGLALIAYCLVLVAAPDVASLAVLGPQPTGGGRFYGATNKIETLLLAPLVAACMSARARPALALAVLALVTIGWSRAGADGGGLLVVASALALVAMLRAGVRFTLMRVALLGLALLAGSLLLVVIDAATGGASHVTDAILERPSELAGDLWGRLRLSWDGMTGTAHGLAVSLLGLAVLTAVAAASEIAAPILALLGGLGVSLVVNDTGADVLLYGMIGALALWSWDRAETSGPPETWRRLSRGGPQVITLRPNPSAGRRQ